MLAVSLYLPFHFGVVQMRLVLFFKEIIMPWLTIKYKTYNAGNATRQCGCVKITALPALPKLQRMLIG